MLRKAFLSLFLKIDIKKRALGFRHSPPRQPAARNATHNRHTGCRWDQVLSGSVRGDTDRLLSAAVVPARTEVDGGSSPSRYKSGAMSALAMSRHLKAAEQPIRRLFSP